MDEAWLGVLELLGDVTRETELRRLLDRYVMNGVGTYVGILVDGTRYQTRHRVILAKDLGERVGEGGRGLDGDKMVFPNVVAEHGRISIVQPKRDRIAATHASPNPNAALLWLCGIDLAMRKIFL